MKKSLSHIEIIKQLKAEKIFLHNKFGVMNIGLFGSYAKGTQREDSDIDLIVELKEPRFEWLAGLQIYLEEKFKRKIELIRKSKKINSRFVEKVGNEVIYV